MGRVASLVLVSPARELLGMLPPLELTGPFWPESADVVAEVAARFQARVVVLRMLRADPSLNSGGHVCYLAELSSGEPSTPLLPVPEELRERALSRDRKRMPWAEVGGPARSLEWASAALEASGQSSFVAVQQRTWNLSTIWRLQTASANDASIWLKQVPHFMGYEGRVLGWLNRVAPGAAPTLLAADDSGRSLLDHVQGDDLYGAPVALRQLISKQLHVIQSASAEAVAELLALGVPDLRGLRRAADIRQKLAAWCPDYPGLEAILSSLDEQLERLEECGLPATLVHSDNHPGNARGSAQGVTLLDWGEAFVGNPVTDLLGLIGGLSAAEAAPLVASWCAGWKSVAPRSKPELALELAPFISALHGAATYAHFLQQIEESEWPYHREDVPRGLKAAAELRLSEPGDALVR
jgi:hypothetical protein